MIRTDVAARHRTRSGLGPAAERLRREPCSIAYLGASVTVQTHGYRPRLHELIRHRFDQDHTSLVAAVGAVGVVSAAFLIDEFVIPRRPDVCLIEYTTAELVRETPIEEVEAAVDGIVRRLRQIECAPVFLHLYRRRWGRHATAVFEAFERAADRHGAPSIDLATPIRAEVDQGRLDEDELLRDVVHTSEDGSRLVAALVDAALAQIVSGSDPRLLPPSPQLEPGSSDYSLARLVPVAPEDAGEGGRMGLFRLQQPYLEIGEGARIRRCFDGRLAGLVVLAGPESGEVRISDPGGEQRRMVWDDTCFYERLMTVLLDRRPSAGAELTIELTGATPDYASCRRPVDPPDRRNLRVAAYMVLED